MSKHSKRRRKKRSWLARVISVEKEPPTPHRASDGSKVEVPDELGPRLEEFKKWLDSTPEAQKAFEEFCTQNGLGPGYSSWTPTVIEGIFGSHPYADHRSTYAAGRGPYASGFGHEY